MVIDVLKHVPRCHTWEQGEVISSAIRKGLLAGEDVVLSFEGVDDVPSAFVNSAFVTLLNDFSFELIQQKLRVVNSTRQINDLIRRRLAFEAGRRSKVS